MKISECNGDIFSCLKPNQVKLTKVTDERLKICVSENEKLHIFTVTIEDDEMQNIETFGEELGYMIKTTKFEIDHHAEYHDKYKSSEIELKWNHATKPSQYEVKKNNEVLFSGTFSDAMEWVSFNVI